MKNSNKVLKDAKRNSYPQKKVDDIQAYMNFLDSAYNHKSNSVKEELSVLSREKTE
mgnify:CR=1 FL=1